MNSLAHDMEEARGLRKRQRPRLGRDLARAARRGSEPSLFVEKVVVSPPRRRQDGDGKGKGKTNGKPPGSSNMALPIFLLDPDPRCRVISSW